MKLNKTLGRVATTLVAGAMLTALAMPAYAASDHGDYSKEPAQTATIDISKKIRKPNNVYLPDEEFSFSIAPLTSGAAYTDGAKIHQNEDEGVPTLDTIKSYPGAELVGQEPEIATNANGSIHTVELADTLKIDLDAGAFTDAGMYQFLITEAQGTYETGYNYDAQYMVLDVIVSRDESVEVNKEDNGLRIYGYELHSYDPETKTIGEGKQDAFVNDYAVSGEQDTTKNLDLTKQVTGDFATSADEATHYTFTIKIENETAGNKKYHVVMNHPTDCASTGRTNITEITANAAATTFTLAEGDTFHIDGLTQNDKVTIKETLDDQSFTTSYKVAEKDTDFATVTATNAKEATVNSVDKDYKVEFTNNKAASPATGIVMNVAPYVLLVVVAAAGCFVFLRKRRED